MNIKLTVSYDGTNYCGWQVQPNGTSVQSVIEDAIFSVTGEKVSLTGSGRTDAGVHAEGQVANFITKKDNIPPENFAFAINAFLPEDVKILSSQAVDETFNARKSAKRKTYCYTFYKSKIPQPLLERYAFRIDENFNLKNAQEVASVFVGEHDFKCFNASGSGAKTTVRTIYSINVTEKDNQIKIYVTGNGFLYNMVRIIAGTLLKAGEEKLSTSQAQEILASGSRELCGKTCPAKALCLLKVEY